MNKDVLKSMRTIIDYMWNDEHKHFEECGKPDDHVWHDVRKVNNFLIDEEVF